jgi:choline dehydrogenase-like flavoprotein
MDHVTLRAIGRGPPLAPALEPEEGACIYLPRFDSRDLPEPREARGFGVQLNQFPANDEWSQFVAVSFAEMLPKPRNRVTLHPTRLDAWGIPVLHIDCMHGDDELAQARDQDRALQALAETIGVKLTSVDSRAMTPGLSAHECGTARMGYDPTASVLDPHNQCWDAKGLYVTDGACFTSQGTQNPTLTILALTARACDHVLRRTQ